MAGKASDPVLLLNGSVLADGSAVKQFRSTSASYALGFTSSHLVRCLIKFATKAKHPPMLLLAVRDHLRDQLGFFCVDFPTLTAHTLMESRLAASRSQAKVSIKSEHIPRDGVEPPA